MLESGLVSPQEQQEDKGGWAALRPRSLDEFVGQDEFRRKLSIYVRAARERGESLDHVLLCGPPGLGKTTMAHIIASSLGVGIQVTSGPVMERAGDLASILSNLQPYEVLFIDEIHRLNRSVEEILYTAMEDYKLDIVVGKGPGARTIRIDLSPFTLVGATTRAGLLTSPLRDRFGIVHNFSFYSEYELAKVCRRAASVLGVEMEDEAAYEIARRSRGTPRVVNRLLKRVRDYAQVEAEGRITRRVAVEALEMMGVDGYGLQENDRRLLRLLVEKYRGFPVGVKTLAVSMGEEPDTIEEVYEPFLIKSGFLARTPRGRVATPRAYEYFGLPVPADASPLSGMEDSDEQPSLPLDES